MTTVLTIGLPRTEATVPADFSTFPQNVVNRLIELGITGYLRSSVNSAFSTELDKAYNAQASVVAAKKAHEDAEAAKLAKNAKYAVKPFVNDAKAIKAFAETFAYKTDPVAVATERLAAFANGEIRMARGQSGTNKLLVKQVRQNIITTLMAKGKKAKEAATMIGDDPMLFIDKTARKRAGDDADAYKIELDKLNAQYVTPARVLLGLDGDASDADDGDATDADDLI